ncbi:ACP S-malonyltransferase [Streptomyces sp. NBC_01497]|uniref:ACP S-malonyltransferase n=1 Tax=Streptomyces sp. NBC_01497 TaxID=2903885 RepID=UPI002E37D5F5|nr:ACP S-malonyltransferase [Streptomyces sp. NBC_01497]
MTRSLSSVDTPRTTGRAVPVVKALGPARHARMAGFFPGLGSRASYQGLGRSLLDSGIPAITAVYEEAAGALGFPGRPDLLLVASENLPEGKLERQGFIGAALLVHSLALDARLRHAGGQDGALADVVAYTGESFGILTAAVASGALSVADGVRIAQVFTPLMLVAAGARDTDEAFARTVSCYLPGGDRRAPLVPEPSHVVAVRAQSPQALETVLGRLREAYPLSDVELHKTYAPTQANLYVRTGVKTEFDRFVARFPRVSVEELKDPTVFLAHSARMRPARDALERFLDINGVRFAEPRVPVVSNHDSSLLTTGAGVRLGVLAMTDRVMASQDTCATLDGLGADLVVELGPGGKSVRLLKDNGVLTPVTAYTAGPGDGGRLPRVLAASERLTLLLERLRTGAEAPGAAHHDALREVFGLAADSEFCDDHFSRVLGRILADEAPRPGRAGAAGFHDFLEVFQHTRNYREHIDAARGELVVRARLKKDITATDPALLGRACVELKVLDAAGATTTRTVRTSRPEVVVVHFDSLPHLGDAEVAAGTRLLLDESPTDLGAFDRARGERLPGAVDLQAGDLMPGTPRRGDTDPVGAGLDAGALSPAGHRVVHPYLLFQALARHRPALFAGTDHYLEATDTEGWLAALAAAGALSLADAVALSTDPGGDTVERILSGLTEGLIPLVSPEGVPVQSRKDLADATRAVLPSGTPATGARRIHLGGNCQIVALGPGSTDAGVDAGPYDTGVVTVREPAEAWRKRLNPALDAFEYTCQLGLTAESACVLDNARSRRVLSSTVCAYIHLDETLVSFGKGGSESMTIFVRKEGEEHITVRKILSEALTTAHWNPEGNGVMLPPFAKAKKQAEFLQSLPASVRGCFPEVFTVLEREIPVPAHRRTDGRTADREVIYEMSYVGGEEVSRFIEKRTPPPAVVARLYEQIIRVLNESVHSENRVPAPGETVDISYFRKIEDRLDLCRRTAPGTFDDALLASEHIVIDGHSYLNAAELLRRFRDTAEFLDVLEPAFHSLVMGDTNTENIKILDTAPLLHAQRVIESGAPKRDVDAALAAITADALGIMFLDPRAIGFKGEGKDTRDDAMYDNKPWHNSLGHYDEIHFERFSMHVATGEGMTPRVDIAFQDGNPYQRSYRVRDVVAHGGTVDTASPRGMEDHFATVMTAALGLDDPDSPFLKDDPYWLVRFVFMMGQHFTAMPPFHFQKELDGTLTDTYQAQRRPVAIYCEGVKWLNWALQMLQGTRTEFLGLAVPPLPHLAHGTPLHAAEPYAPERVDEAA